MQMEVSRGGAWNIPHDVKSAPMASTSVARVRLSTSMWASGLPTRKHAKNLGIDYATGVKTHKRIVLDKKLSKIKSKGIDIDRIPVITSII